jgi:hypothetical protein
MGKIFSDMYSGDNIYINNKDHYDYYNNQSEGGWLNGFKISTSVNNSIAAPPPPPSGSSGEVSWMYQDPGCGFGLNSLAYDGIYIFNKSLTEGTTVTVNWYFTDTSSNPTKPACTYSSKGRMWIENQNVIPSVTVCGSKTVDLNIDNTPFQQQLSWTVPQNGSAIYSIGFQNRATRKTGTSCGTTTPRSMSDFSLTTIPPGRPTFSGIGETNHTWVKIGNSSIGGAMLYQDYTITTTARLRNTDILSITACVRQTPGPSLEFEHQSLAVVSWIVCYDPPCINGS